MLPANEQSKKPQVCSYMSKALTEAHKKWHSYQLKMFAIAMALRQNKTFFAK